MSTELEGLIVISLIFGTPAVFLLYILISRRAKRHAREEEKMELLRTIANK